MQSSWEASGGWIAVLIAPCLIGYGTNAYVGFGVLAFESFVLYFLNETKKEIVNAIREGKPQPILYHHEDEDN